MSKSKLDRIEKQLARLVESQAAILRRVSALETRISGDESSVGADELIEFLDGFRAGEALGEASLGAWIEASDTPCLKGGLRTIQCREGMHARLLEQRIKELGGSPKAEIPEAIYTSVMEGAASTETSDAHKVREFVERFPDIDAAIRPIHEMAERLGGDLETRSLLRTIAQDERATLEFMAEACALLND